MEILLWFLDREVVERTPRKFVSTSPKAFIGFLAAWPVTVEQLKEATIQSELLDYEEKYIPDDIKARCEELIPNPVDVQPKDCVDAFLYLKEGVDSI
ncbi:Hypothetical predicted protein [Paramuricea clavata]|uniref:Uncharacterized protein n=1 Tax=Paramuricea clavata TaxID=317549 RepID=A0A6S7FUH2_PARCT|nr:Hypothetical predicted protein [Paramuricea clavata]